MNPINTLNKLGTSLWNIVFRSEDIEKATDNLTIEADSELKPDVIAIVGTGNLIINDYVRIHEGRDVSNYLNSGVLKVENDLGGAAGTYQPSRGVTSLLRKYVINHVQGLGVYMHEAGHRLLDKVFGYERKLENIYNEERKKNPLKALYTAVLGNMFNEGLTDLEFRLRLLGENGFRSVYQEAGFVGAAAYAKRKVGGTIKNVVNKLSKAIGYFGEALSNRRLARQADYA